MSGEKLSDSSKVKAAFVLSIVGGFLRRRGYKKSSFAAFVGAGAAYTLGVFDHVRFIVGGGLSDEG